MTAFNPYSINPQIGNPSMSIVDVLAPASSPNANISYQTEAMYGNATTVLALAQQGANKDVAAGAGSKSTYSAPTGGQSSGGLNVNSAAKEVDTALDGIVSSSFGNQQKPQNNVSAMFLAIADVFIKTLNQKLVGAAAGTPISNGSASYSPTH